MFPTSRSHRWRHCASLCALLFSIAACSPSAPHAHAATQANPAEPAEPDPVAVTVFTDEVQLFMEFPRLLPGLEARFLAHLTVLADGAPVRSGQLRLELTPSTGPAVVFEALQPKRDGLFIPVGAMTSPGSYQARIVVASEQVNATIPLAPIEVYPDLDAAFAAAAAENQPDPVNAVPFLLEQQWKIGMQMRPLQRRSLIKRLQVPGEIQVPNHARAEVGAPLAGRLLPTESGDLPRLGDRVEKDQILAYLEQPLSTSDAAQLAANHDGHAVHDMELRLRDFDLLAKEMEAEQDLQQAQARLRFARQSLQRMDGLRAKDLGTVAEQELARRDVQLGEQEQLGAEARIASFAKMRRQLNDLREEHEAERLHGEEDLHSLHPLRAPIAGEIVRVDHVIGEHVDAQDPVYGIADLSTLWLVAHVSEFDLATLGLQPGALAECAAFPQRRFDILADPGVGGLGGRLAHFSRLVDETTRSVALRYEFSGGEIGFCDGMFADVFLQTSQAVDAVALMEESIVMDNGRAVAFVVLSGETLQKRVLELGIRDGGWVEVLSGLEAGERVVTRGAYLVKLAAASPASFGEGHVH